MASAGVAEDVASPARSTGQRFYQPELDCLRFFAFFAVFLYHSFGGDRAYYAARHVPLSGLVAAIVSSGRFGVDLFFLLSAYLITELLLREQDRFGKIDVRSFYVRRILRIWPLYFLALAIGVVVAWADPALQHFPLRYAVAFVLMSGNWLAYFGANVQSVMWPLWSVSFEEQFYLLWPTLMAKAGQRKVLLSLCGFLLLVATASRLLMAEHSRAMGSQVPMFTSSLTRLDPLAIGIATAVLLHGKNLNLKGLSRTLLLVAGCVIWTIAGHSFGLSTTFLLFGYPAIALGAWMIFRSALGAPLAPGWLRYLGKISYGLYVFHELALYCSMKFMGGSVHNLTSVVGLLLTIGMASLSYRYFESPFLDLKERFARVQSRPV